MFCPRCGNQPVVDRMRFCPSCGFRLDGVVDLLARDGAPGYPQMTSPPEGPSPRKRGIRRGAKILFTSLGLFPLVLAFAIGVVESPGPLVLPLTLFLIGALMMLYYRFFEEDRSAAPEAYRIPAPPPQPVYLQPPQAPVYRPPVEPHPPQSVGEHTTRSLGQ